jgi:hypothetical protein
MLELAALLCFFVGFAVLHASARYPISHRKPAAATLALLRTVALGATALGVTVFARSENTVAALLVGTAALSFAGALVVLLAPLFPRALWVSALACLPLVLVLLAVGSARD